MPETDPFAPICSLSLDELEDIVWTESNHDGIPQIGEVKFGGEALDPDVEEDKDFFDCFVSMRDKFKKLEIGRLIILDVPYAAADAGSSRAPDGGAAVDGAAPPAPAPSKRAGAKVEYADAAKIPDVAKRYIDAYFSGRAWNTADRVKVAIFSFDDGARQGLSVTVTRGKNKGTGYARCLTGATCARTAVDNAVNDLRSRETAPDKPAARK